MLNHVLVPLDGSELAEMALPHAQQLVGKEGKITLLSVVYNVDPPVYDFYPVRPMAPIGATSTYENVIDEMVEQARQYLQSTAKKLREGKTVGTVELEIYRGEPAETIVKVAEEINVDSIVICTHGRTGVNRWLFGSVTNKVLTAAPCPVYVIPNRKLADS